MKDELRSQMFDVRGWKARPLLRIRYGMFEGTMKVDPPSHASARQGDAGK